MYYFFATTLFRVRQLCRSAGVGRDSGGPLNKAGGGVSESR